MKDMTKGSPLKLIIMFSIPLLIGNIFQQFYSLVDTIIVGNYLGPDALAAVGTTGPLSFLILGFGNGIGAGFNVIVAQFFGAKNTNNLKKAIANGIVLNIIISALLTIFALSISRTALELIKVPEEIIQMSASYINVIYLGMIFSNFYNLASGTLRSLGDSKTPLYILILASIINIILDILFIGFLDFGTAGAAYATIISQAISFIVCYIIIFTKYKDLRLTFDDFKLKKYIAKQELIVGLPMALQFSVTAIGVLVLQSAVNNLGTTVMASYTASNKIENLAMCSFIAVGTAMSTYAGQNYGAGQIDRLKKGMKLGAIIELILSLISYILVVFLGETFVNIFISNPSQEIIDLTVKYLAFTGLFYPFLSMIFLNRTSLQSMGDNLFPLMGGVIELLARVITSLTLPNIIDYYGICMSGASAWLLAGLFVSIRMIFYLRHLDQKKIDFNEQI